jgi:hypothetical protein
MMCEMISVEIIRRRLKAWLDHKKEIRHAIAKNKAIGMPTKSSMRALEMRNPADKNKTDANKNNASTTAATSASTQNDSNKMSIEPSVSKPVKIVQEENTLADDTLISNTMADVECICCKVKGDRKVN